MSTLTSVSRLVNRLERFKADSGRFFHRLGLTADFLTYSGLALAGVSAVYLWNGRFFEAGLLLLLSGLTDLLDGSVARAAGKAKPFGGILDSSLDRYGDGLVLAAAAVVCVRIGREDLALWASSALIGSFAVSYVRARAECVIQGCRIGFWERGERLAFLALGLMLGNLALVLPVLGIGVHWTVFQRLRLSYLACAEPARRPQGTTRSATAYWIKISVLAAALVLLRIPL